MQDETHISHKLRREGPMATKLKRGGCNVLKSPWAWVAGIALSAAACQPSPTDVDSVGVNSIEDSSSIEASAPVYETDYTVTRNVNTPAENVMRERLETFIAEYTENFVERAQSGQLENIDRCISSRSGVNVSQIRNRPMPTAERQFKIAIIDAGHGREATNARVGYDTGAYVETETLAGDPITYEETQIVSEVSEELTRQLEAEGFIVINMRGDTRNGLSLSGLDTKLSLGWRSQIATRIAEEFPEALVMYVHPHADSVANPEFRNPTAFAYATQRNGETDSNPSERLAYHFSQNYRLSEWAPLARTGTKNLATLRCQSNEVATVLMELGNLHSPSDQIQFSKVILNQEGKTEELAELLRDGILGYVSEVAPHLVNEDTFSFSMAARTALPTGALRFASNTPVS